MRLKIWTHLQQLDLVLLIIWRTCQHYLWVEIKSLQCVYDQRVLCQPIIHDHVQAVQERRSLDDGFVVGIIQTLEARESNRLHSRTSLGLQYPDCLARDFIPLCQTIFLSFWCVCVSKCSSAGALWSFLSPFRLLDVKRFESHWFRKTVNARLQKLSSYTSSGSFNNNTSNHSTTSASAIAESIITSSVTAWRSSSDTLLASAFLHTEKCTASREDHLRALASCSSPLPAPSHRRSLLTKRLHASHTTLLYPHIRTVWCYTQWYPSIYSRLAWYQNVSIRYRFY